MTPSFSCSVRTDRRPALFLFLALLASWASGSVDSKLSSSSPQQTIPRSTDWSDDRFPPWNLSPKIDDDGFLADLYSRVPGDWEPPYDDRRDKESSTPSPKSSPSSWLTRPNESRGKQNVDPASLLSPADIVQIPCRVRQVPGDGNCLFHSITTCYVYAVNGTHLDLKNRETLQWLYRHSAFLRQQAVDCLEHCIHPKSSEVSNSGGSDNSKSTSSIAIANRLRTHLQDKHLFLQNEEYLKASDLVEAAAAQYGISGPEYCRLMRQESYWGGGPEIVALSNVLQRPIHVYELHTPEDDNGGNQNGNGKRKKPFVLRRMACFGSPNFDNRSALHILSADSKFPDLEPGSQLASGNHFLALFPQWSACEGSAPIKQQQQQQRLRGGDADDHRARISNCEDDCSTLSRVTQFWRRCCSFWYDG